MKQKTKKILKKVLPISICSFVTLVNAGLLITGLGPLNKKYDELVQKENKILQEYKNTAAFDMYKKNQTKYLDSYENIVLNTKKRMEEIEIAYQPSNTDMYEEYLELQKQYEKYSEACIRQKEYLSDEERLLRNGMTSYKGTKLYEDYCATMEEQFKISNAQDLCTAIGAANLSYVVHLTFAFAALSSLDKKKEPIKKEGKEKE